MKSEQWKTYRTRFLVNAKQLSSALSFTDHLGRQHCGRKGDYLVESGDGVLSIAPRQIFEDIYVEMTSIEASAAEPAVDRRRSVSVGNNEVNLKYLRIEPLHLERIQTEKFQQPVPARRRTDREEPSRARRKSPQPVRTSRVPSHLGLM
jgi:hypothetical protein